MCPGILVTGVEKDPATATLARYNLDRNGLGAARLLDVALDDAACGPFDHALANPPWHRASASASPEPRRDLARRAAEDGLHRWVAAIGRLLRPGGTLTLVLPAALHAEAAASMTLSGIGTIRLLPLWPMPDRPARIVLVQGILGGHGDGTVLPGLMLHRSGGGFTEAAEAVLRHGAALPMIAQDELPPCPGGARSAGPRLDHHGRKSNIQPVKMPAINMIVKTMT